MSKQANGSKKNYSGRKLIDKRAQIDAFIERIKNDPECLMLASKFLEYYKSDVNELSLALADLSLNFSKLEKHNEMMQTELASIYRTSQLLNGMENVPPVVKYPLARWFLENGRTDLVAGAFLSGAKTSKQVQALDNAEKRHAENRAMKAEVFKWLSSHMINYKSMDAAAEAIAGKIAPITFRTARTWVGQWKKQLSASTL